MATKGKTKSGNGAGTQMQQAQSTQQRNPARAGEHPLTRLRQEIDSLFDHFFSRWPGQGHWDWPMERMWGMDVQETDNEILVRAEAPGFEPKDFDIQVEGNVLTIRAEHRQEAEEKEGEGRTWQQSYGRMQRSIMLPAAVDPNKVEAHYRNGILELRLPRSEEAQRRRIEVKA